MVKRKKGGIGAVGAPFARFLHPSKVIQTKWPNDWKVRKCSGALIVGKGMHNVSRKMQLCYELRLPEFDDGTIFHIVVCNFSIITEGPTPFDDEVTTGATAPPIGTRGSAPILADEPIFPQRPDVGRDTDVVEARANGIEVDDEDPAPENVVEQPPAAGQVGEWVRQRSNVVRMILKEEVKVINK